MIGTNPIELGNYWVVPWGCNLPFGPPRSLLITGMRLWDGPQLHGRWAKNILFRFWWPWLRLLAYFLVIWFFFFLMIQILENSSLIRIYLVPMQFSLLYEYLHEYFYFALGPHTKLWGWGLVWRVKVHILEDERAPCIMSLAFNHLYMQLTFGRIPIWWTAEFNHRRRHLSLLVQMSRPLNMILSGGGEYHLCT